MKKQTGWLLPATLLPICLLLYVAIIFPQDRIFAEYRQAFQGLQHPQGTRFVAAYNAFGALDKIRTMYNEDLAQGCDYRVGEVREYSGDRRKIEAFYRIQTIEVRGESLSPGVLFIPLNELGLVDPYALPEEDLIQRGPGAFDLLENLQDDQTSLGLKPFVSYYYVAIGGFSLSDYDPRCR